MYTKRRRMKAPCMLLVFWWRGVYRARVQCCGTEQEECADLVAISALMKAGWFLPAGRQCVHGEAEVDRRRPREFPCPAQFFSLLGTRPVSKIGKTYIHEKKKASAKTHETDTFVPVELRHACGLCGPSGSDSQYGTNITPES